MLGHPTVFSSHSKGMFICLLLFVKIIFLDRSFDESTWGAFENNDDTDSVWGFNPVKTKVNQDLHPEFYFS